MNLLKVLHETKKKLRKIHDQGCSCVSITVNPFFEFFLWSAKEIDVPLIDLESNKKYKVFFAYEYKRLNESKYDLQIEYSAIKRADLLEVIDFERRLFTNILGVNENNLKYPNENYFQKEILKENTLPDKEIIVKCSYNKHHCPTLKIFI